MGRLLAENDGLIGKEWFQHLFPVVAWFHKHGQPHIFFNKWFLLSECATGCDLVLLAPFDRQWG